MPLANGHDLFKSLNKAQCRAVSSEAPTVAILAGPGSGKTHTLTSRVVWLIDHAGIRPQDVLVATFTNKASNEMKARIGQALGDGREKSIVIGTFHSIARRYLVKYGQRIGLDPRFGIADDSDSRGIITRICKRLDTPIEPPVARAWISKRKAKGTSDERAVKDKKGQNVESKALESCYEEYQSQLERSNLLDYDDLLVRGVELLRKFPQCVSNIQTVLIDEYQDTNGVQYDLMKLFAQKHRRVTVVGDPDQSIYGWRSAEIKNLHRLLRDYPGTDEISLEENYRSSSCILDTSLKVIQQDQERYKKVLLPVRDKGTRPVIRRLQNSTSEADWIVSEIKRIRLLSGNMIDFDDCAILLRSAALSRHVESTLGREGIAYRMVGGFKFYERTEIKIILDYMRVIHQPDNNDAFARIMNVPKRGIGEVTIKSLLEEAEKSSISLWKLIDKHCRGERKAKTSIRQQTEISLSRSLMKPLHGIRQRILSDAGQGTPMNLVELVQKLVRDLKFEDYLEATYGAEYEPRWANVQEFVTLAEEFMRQSQVDDEPLPTIDGVAQAPDEDLLARFLSNVSLASDKQTEDKDQEGKPLVTISTIHAAKGLEWPVVFIPSVYDGSIPHIRADDQNEERRLLYVAMTRAKALLYLSCPQNIANGGGKTTELSSFIKALPSSVFLTKGPSFDRPVMASVATILGRELPPDSVIYKSLPSMTPPEDNLFPVDPSQPSNPRIPDEASQAAWSRKQQNLQRPPAKSVPVAEESVEGWAAPYKTTMQRAASFTVPQTAGFTTAGAHMADIAAAAAEAKSVTATTAATAGGARAPARGSGAPLRRTTSTTNRPPNQKSLLGYGYGVTNHDKSKETAATATDDIAAGEQVPRIPKRSLSTPVPPPPYARRRRLHPPQNNNNNNAYQLPAPAPAIEPELAAHRLGGGGGGSGSAAAKLPATKPAPPPRHRADDDINATLAAARYACFSSSPPRPPTAAAAAVTTTKGRGDKENAGGNEEEEEEEPRRPAASFHATTVTGTGPLSWQQQRGVGIGIRRPMGLGRAGIAPMEKLNKPYKLTVKRP